MKQFTLHTLFLLSLTLAQAAPTVLTERKAPKSPKPTSTPKVPNTGNWTKTSCTNLGVVDAGLPPADRWAWMDVEGAWNAAERDWNEHAAPSGDVPLTFSQSLSNYFHLADFSDCQDITDKACGTPVECQNSYAPSFFIFNSFVNIHETHRKIHDAIDQAELPMALQIDSFSSVFAPATSDEAFLKEILDGLVLALGVSSAYSWNIVLKQVFKDNGDAAGELHGFWKDTANAAITFSMNSAKDNLPTGTSQDGIANTIKTSMASFFTAWQDAETAWVQQTFQGNSKSLTTLSSMMSDGQMIDPSFVPDFSDLTTQAYKIAFAQMIKIAWSVAPDNLTPFILKTTFPCSSDVPEQLKTYMQADVAAQTHVCYNGNTYYVLWPVRAALLGHSPGGTFAALPGGTFDTLSGQNAGGVKLDDIVISSYAGYQLNGNKNGYSMPDLSQAIDGSGTQGDVPFQAGIQTPGFFNYPICDDVQKTINQMMSNSGGDNWPCNY